MEELLVFEKDPDTQDMLVLPPSLETNGYVHVAVYIVLRRDSNLGSTRGLTHRETRVPRAYVHTRVVIGQHILTTF